MDARRAFHIECILARSGDRDLLKKYLGQNPLKNYPKITFSWEL